MQHEYECWSFVTIITVYRHEDTLFRISSKRLWRIILLRISVLLEYFPSWRRLVFEKSTAGRLCKNSPSLREPESLLLLLLLFLLLLSHSSPLGSAAMQVVHTSSHSTPYFFTTFFHLRLSFASVPSCHVVRLSCMLHDPPMGERPKLCRCTWLQNYVTCSWVFAW